MCAESGDLRGGQDMLHCGIGRVHIIDNDNDFALDLSIMEFNLSASMKENHALKVAYAHYLASMEESKSIRHSARKVFGTSLRQTRKELGMTVRELGARIGVTGSLINQVETVCKSILKPEHIDKIVSLCYEEKPHCGQKAGSKSAEAG